VFALLALLALAFAAAALLPEPLRTRFPGLARRVWPYREALGGAAAAIFVGVALGLMLG
jgi:hypothetical protein